jgi:putative spermidine/putrescine transport system permease protein
MLAPVMAVVLLLFMGGLFLGLIQSFGYMPVIGQTDFNLNAYVNIFNDPAFKGALLQTIWISFTSTILSTILAIICALVLRQTLFGKKLTSFIFQLNVPVPHIVGAIAILFLFSQSGMISRITYHLGWTERPSDFPALVFDPLSIGIILEYLWKTVAFTGVILLAVLTSLGENYEDLARSLGANRWQRFWFVILPLIMPGVLRSSILVFAFAFGAFEVPYLLGQKYPPALPVLAYEYYRDVDLGNRQEAMAISMIIAAMITVLILVYMKLVRTYVRSD